MRADLVEQLEEAIAGEECSAWCVPANIFLLRQAAEALRALRDAPVVTVRDAEWTIIRNDGEPLAESYAGRNLKLVVVGEEG